VSKPITCRTFHATSTAAAKAAHRALQAVPLAQNEDAPTHAEWEVRGIDWVATYFSRRRRLVIMGKGTVRISEVLAALDGIYLRNEVVGRG
jgi:hypothetical protein